MEPVGSGSLRMTTFRKLPMMQPNMKTAALRNKEICTNPS
jgi:hypothetical protein